MSVPRGAAHSDSPVFEPIRPKVGGRRRGYLPPEGCDPGRDRSLCPLVRPTGDYAHALVRSGVCLVNRFPHGPHLLPAWARRHLQPCPPPPVPPPAESDEGPEPRDLPGSGERQRCLPPFPLQSPCDGAIFSSQRRHPARPLRFTVIKETEGKWFASAVW